MKHLYNVGILISLLKSNNITKILITSILWLIGSIVKFYFAVTAIILGIKKKIILNKILKIFLGLKIKEIRYFFVISLNSFTVISIRVLLLVSGLWFKNTF